MHNVCFCDQYSKEVVYMSWEALEACDIAHEAMDIDAQKLSSLMLHVGLGWY